MAIATTPYIKTFKNPVETVLKDVGTGSVLVLPGVASASIDTGIEQAEIEAVNCAGVIGTDLRYTSKEKPKVVLSFGANTPEAISVKLGKKFDAATSDSTIRLARSAFQVPSDGIVAAKASGTFGFDVAANAVTSASYLDSSGFSVALTQDTNFASFDPVGVGNDLKFAVGANGAMKFGQGLWNAYVTFEIPMTVASVRSLGTTPFVALSLKVVVLTIDGTLAQWIFNSVSPDSTGSIPLSDPKLELPFFVNGTYGLKYINQLSPC